MTNFRTSLMWCCCLAWAPDRVMSRGTCRNSRKYLPLGGHQPGSKLRPLPSLGSGNQRCSRRLAGTNHCLSVRYRTGWHYPEIPHADARVLPPPLRPQVAIPPRLEPLHLHLLAFACQVCLFGARSGPSFKRRLFLGEVSSTKPSRPWIAT